MVDAIILGIALAAAVVSVNHMRGLLWIAAVCASFYLSGLYWDSGLPEPALVGGMCDAIVCLSLFFLASKIWEFWLWGIMLASVFVNCMLLAVDGEYLLFLSICLEVLTAAALFLVLGISGFVRRGKTNVVAFHSWRHILGFARPVLFKDR